MLLYGTIIAFNLRHNKQENLMSDESTFQIINFGADLLGSYYSAKQQTASLLTLPSVPSNVSLSSNNSNAPTPWDQDKLLEQQRLAENSSTSALYKLLEKDYAAIKNQDEFINPKDPLIRTSNLDDDSKNLFTLYNALKDLKTIAEYAGDPRTRESARVGIEELFQTGFAQVKDFITTEEFEDLTLLFGEKKSGVTSGAGLGKKEYDYIGPVIHEGEKNETLSTLDGGETFTITITRKTTNNGVTTEDTTDFNINVPVNAGERTLENLLAQINEKVKAIKTTNNDGDEIPLYNTRFFAEEIENDKFALRIKTDFNETLSFSASDTEPAIYITGITDRITLGTKLIDEDVPTTSYITKLTNLDEMEATQEFHKLVYGNESEPFCYQRKIQSPKRLIR